MNILCVAAHPDDIEILCAGTLIRYAEDGHKITMAVFTAGNMGDIHIQPSELERIRKQETMESAAVIGAQVIWGGIVDELVFPDLPQRHRMIDILRQADPDVIFTHSPNDYHPDHRYVGQLVFDAYFQKGLPHIPNQLMPACRFGQTQLYYLDNLGGIGFLPAEYVDISTVMDKKLSMLACHKSQVGAMRELARTDLIEMTATQGRFRGLAAGCRFAEGFIRSDSFQRGLTKRILP